VTSGTVRMRVIVTEKCTDCTVLGIGLLVIYLYPGFVMDIIIVITGRTRNTVKLLRTQHTPVYITGVK
jgi:hypothetical protein